MRIKPIRMSDGEEYSILIDSAGFPMTYPNLFVTVHHRNAGFAANSSKKQFEHIKYLYEILEFLNINIIQRCWSGVFLTQIELKNLVTWAKKEVEYLRSHSKEQTNRKVVQISPKAEKLEAARATIVVDKESNVALSSAYNRITTFADYIGWLEGYLSPTKTSKSAASLKNLRPKISDGVKDSSDNPYKSLTIAQVDKILHIVRPESADNPWINEGVRQRNQLICNILEATGCRRGELLKIRLDDIKRHPSTNQRYLTLRNKVDFEDTRIDRPNAKTLARKVPIDSRVGEMIDDYIIGHRANVSGAEFIPYLFVTHNKLAPRHFTKSKVEKNKALSISAVTKIFREITHVVGFPVSPHAFRHSWNDRFSEYADERIAKGKTTAAKSESDRQKLMGWKEGSKMAGHYSRRHTDRKAFETGLELQERGSSRIEITVGNYDDNLPF